MSRAIKRSIFSKLPTIKHVHVLGPISTTPEPVCSNPEPVRTTNATDSACITKAIDRKLFRHQQYLKVLQQFITERCEFSQSALLDYDVVREAWYVFIRDNHDEMNKLDCNMRFSPQDVVLVDDRFQYKRVYFCRECKRRHYHKCCDGYQKGHRYTRYGMVGLSLKSNLALPNIDANE